MSSPHPLPRLGGVIGLVLGLALAGCHDFSDVTASIAPASSPLPADESGMHDYADRWEKSYTAHPGEKYASINYARALRAMTRYKEAEAVMQQAAIRAPKDFEVLGEYGKALADAGDLQQARDVLTRSYTADRPNWDFLSAQGSVADRLDDHARAQEYYEDALKISPEEPAVLSNLGLSYALSKRLDDAEATLRHAATLPRADARVRQNFALVLALEGKFGEAEQVSAHDMSPADASKNVQAIREMIAQSDSWRTIQAGPHKARVKPEQG